MNIYFGFLEPIWQPLISDFTNEIGTDTSDCNSLLGFGSRNSNLNQS